MSTATSFPGAHVEKACSGELGGDGTDRWEESEGASETEVSGQLRRIMEGQSQPNSSSGLQRTNCSGSAWSPTSSSTALQHDMT